MKIFRMVQVQTALNYCEMNEEKPWSTGRPTNSNSKRVQLERQENKKFAGNQKKSRRGLRGGFRFLKIFLEVVFGRGLIGWVMSFVLDHTNWSKVRKTNQSFVKAPIRDLQKPPPPPITNRSDMGKVDHSQPKNEASSHGKTHSQLKFRNGSRIFVGMVCASILLVVVLSVLKDQQPQKSVQTDFGLSSSSLPSDSVVGQSFSSWENLARSIALISVESDGEYSWGSGTLIIDGSYLMTNYHVAKDALSTYEVSFAETYDVQPNESYKAEFVMADPTEDLAILRIVDSFGEPVFVTGRSPITLKDLVPSLNDEITLIGYPGIGASENEVTVTITNGKFSGRLTIDGDYFKTSAIVSGGISGGAAFDSFGNFIGIPSASMGSDDFNAALGLIKPARAAIELISKVKP